MPKVTKSDQKQKEENNNTTPAQPQSAAATITQPLSQGQNAPLQIEPATQTTLPNQTNHTNHTTRSQYIQTQPLQVQQQNQ